MNWRLLANSLLVAGLVTSLASLFGFAVAAVLAASPTALRKVLFSVTLAVLALPAFLVTNCWIDLLGLNGLLYRWLPLNIFSLGGTVWILSLLLWPIPALGIFSAWQKLEPAQFEIDSALRGWNLFRFLLWPAARPMLAVTAAIVFALALNNFAVPAILQVKVFPAEVWVQFNTNLDPWSALQLSWPLLLAPVLLLLVLRRNEFVWPRETASDIAPCLRRQLGAGWLTATSALSLLTLIFALAVPLVQLTATPRTWSELLPAFTAGQTALANSFIYATTTALLTVLLGLMLVRVRGLGWLWLFFLVPGVLLGIGALTAFNRPGLDWFSRTSLIVVFVLVARYFALARSLTRAAHQSLDLDLMDAARMEGARGATLFRRVVLPQIAPPLAAAAYIVYVLCLWDVETILLVIPPGGETLALRIFNLLHYGHNSHVNALCLLLLLLALAPLLLFAVWRIFGGWLGGSRPEGPSFVSPGRNNAQPWVKGEEGISPERAEQNRLDVESVRELFRPFRAGRISWPCNPGLCPGLTNDGPSGLNQRSAAIFITLLFLVAGCSRQAADVSATPLHSSIFSHVEIIGARGTGPGEFNKPRSLTLDTNDNLYVVDMTGRVQKFSPDGKFALSWQMPQTDLGKPKGMWCDREGNIVVLEPHYQRVNHFTPDGKLVAQWGIRGTNAGELTLPRAIAVDTKNNVIVSEYTLVDRVQKFSARGARCLGAWGTPGLAAGEFNRAEGVGVDAADRIYIADSCNHRIQIFSPDGKFLRAYGQAGDHPGEMSYPYDIRVDEQGRQYVCEFGNSRIQVFDANDHSLETIGKAGLEPGEFANPWSIALDSMGNLFVADSMNHRVQKLVRQKKA